MAEAAGDGGEEVGEYAAGAYVYVAGESHAGHWASSPGQVGQGCFGYVHRHAVHGAGGQRVGVRLVRIERRGGDCVYAAFQRAVSLERIRIYFQRDGIAFAM
ncbi:MAG: hypothetical protein WDN04_05940 [Rhodospirillales bacterium]